MRSTAGTGTYSLSYAIVDASGNESDTIFRTVEVVDTRAPVIGHMSFPGNAVDSDYYYVDWYIPGAHSVTISGGLLTGTTNVKMISSDVYRIFVPLIQDSVNSFDLVATDISGNQSSTNFGILEASTGEKNYFRLTAFGGTHVTDVSLVTGTNTGATKIIPKIDLTITEDSEDSNTRVRISQDTEITRKGGGTFDPTQIKTETIAVTGGLTGTDRSRGAIEFGKSGTPLLFSKPVRVEFSLSGTSYTGTTIEVKVKHAGESTFTTSGLTNNSGATCSSGLASTGTNIGTIVENVVTIYTCAASTFAAVTPDGPQNTAPTNSVVSTGGGGGGGGGSSGYYTQTAVTTSVASGSTTSSGSVLVPISSGTVNVNTGIIWTPVVSVKKFSKKIEKYTLALPTTHKRNTIVSLPVRFANGTKVTIRLTNTKIRTTVTATVKNGAISFRPRTSGTYEVIKK